MKKLEKLESKRVKSIHAITGGKAMMMDTSLAESGGATFKKAVSDHGNHNCTDYYSDPRKPHDCPGGLHG
ncbi:hypothetical protein GJU39_19960 [Pedobacter petrophilus]|uniref:Uncharacterized protein n=1 Tax=Pedobacter petrophilus TaxID=1908241 RepID=A0A7K0G3H3_9SPHI|nr:hypothetical protein [Pedobacter petrophilus]MRX78363.1 hypothetical protein [Pedobacter petrophilus]